MTKEEREEISSGLRKKFVHSDKERLSKKYRRLPLN